GALATRSSPPAGNSSASSRSSSRWTKSARRRRWGSSLLSLSATRWPSENGRALPLLDQNDESREHIRTSLPKADRVWDRLVEEPKQPEKLEGAVAVLRENVARRHDLVCESQRSLFALSSDELREQPLVPRDYLRAR